MSGATIPRRSSWNAAAALLWAAVLAGLLLRAGLHPARPTSLTIYLAGGSAWAAAQPLYTNWRGFVYPPVIAWCFSLLTHLPAALAATLWRLLTAGGLLGGICALLRSGLFHRIPGSRHGLVLIGLLPLSVGNLDNAQANPLLAGLLMLSVAALQGEAWTLCALAGGIATMLKVYPAALMLLLCILRPRQLSWRFALVLLLLGLLPFAVADPGYVAGQYHAWLRSRLADNRFQYPMKDAPLDLWYLLVRLGHLPISPRVYTALQVLAGGALALLAWLRRAAPPRETLPTLFLLASVWMLLLGPATENQTYVLLAAPASLLAVESLFASEFHRHAVPVRLLSLSAFTLLLAAVARNGLAPHLKSPLFMAIQPVAALVLLAAICLAPPEMVAHENGRPWPP